MSALKFLFVALSLAGSVQALGQTRTEATEVGSQGAAAAPYVNQVCVTNHLDRAVGMVSTWGAGDGWRTTVLARGETVIFSLTSWLAFEPQLTVRYRDYFGGILVTQKQLASEPPLSATYCSLHADYAFFGFDDGHLRQRVILDLVAP